MNERRIDFVASATAFLAGMLALYFLTAPPIMTAMVRHSGTVSFPALYWPIIRLIESDFNGPVLWYFNDVWKCEVAVIGEVTIPWYVLMSYTALGLGLLGALLFPMWRRIRNRKKMRVTERMPFADGSIMEDKGEMTRIKK